MIAADNRCLVAVYGFCKVEGGQLSSDFAITLGRSLLGKPPVVGEKPTDIELTGTRFGASLLYSRRRLGRQERGDREHATCG
jgi:hypothetical protein